MTDTIIFDYFKTPLKIDKPIRLIELFAGVGSQAKALARLGADFEHYRISEWEVNAAASYKAIHKTDDSTDYSTEFTADELTEVLYNIGISTDGKKPLTLKEIARKGEQWKRTVYNNFKATNNVGSILNISGADLGIVDTDAYCYVMTYSFPCQDLSLAGKQKGMEKGSGTRSGLLWEVERLLNECDELPQILLMENVTQVHGTKNREHFDEWIAFLESKGYSNYWQDLNSKNFGIPQNRNRTFMVSVLGEYTYEFPEEFPLKLRLKDMLEDAVDEKFYISDGKIEKIVNGDISKTVRAGGKGSLDRHSWDLVADTRCEQAGVLVGGKWDKMHDVSRRVYSEDGIAPTLHTCGGGNTEPKVIAGVGEKKSNGGTQWYQQDRIYDDNVAISVTTAFNPYYATAMRGRTNEDGEIEQNIEVSDREYANAITTVQKDSMVAEGVELPCSTRGKQIASTIRATIHKQGSRNIKENIENGLGYEGVIEPVRLGYIPYPNSNKAHQSNSFYDESAISPTLDTCEGGNRQVKILNNGVRIRKLTPKECWRLMGFDDADFEKAAAVNSNSQLYKQAGNSIVVDVLYYIFGMML